MSDNTTFACIMLALAGFLGWIILSIHTSEKAESEFQKQCLNKGGIYLEGKKQSYCAKPDSIIGVEP